MIKIGKGKRPAVLNEVEPNHIRHVGKCSIVIIGVTNIPLVPAPGAIGADQFVDGVPSLLVFVGRSSLIG